LYSLILKRDDIIDTAWGMGFALVALISMFLKSSFEIKNYIILGFILLWGLRIAWHIYLKNKNRVEDIRYTELKKNWRKYNKLKVFLRIYLLQAIAILLISSPVVVGYFFGTGEIGIWFYLGVLIWITGFLLESIGDYQRLKFNKNQKKKTTFLRGGLWKYSRHPNYFGEILIWWGIYFMTLGTTQAFYGVLGPIAITYLIVLSSGIPVAEGLYKGNKEYEKYKKRTSILFPMLPK